jgi:hypothetical protein
MPNDVESCTDILKAVFPNSTSAMSSDALRVLASRVYQTDTTLKQDIAARSAQFNPRAPIYLFVHEIVIASCAIYTIYDIVGKIDKIAGVIVDRETQVKIMEKTIERLRQFGLSYPADKLQILVDKLLDYMTRPNSTALLVGEKVRVSYIDSNGLPYVFHAEVLKMTGRDRFIGRVGSIFAKDAGEITGGDILALKGQEVTFGTGDLIAET